MKKAVSNSLKAIRKIEPVRFDLAESASVNRVEGLAMSKEMLRMFQGFELSGLSHEARRTALKNRFGKFGG